MFSRHGLLDPDDARGMLAWASSGFSLDASVRIAGHDRAGLERLLRYCARPPFALERIEQINEERIVYIVCRGPSATGELRCPSPRWSSSTPSPP